MKLVDVCDDYAGEGSLKKYYEENKITNYKIISLVLKLSAGDIKNNHLAFLRTIYNDEFYDYNFEINEVLTYLNDYKIRIWTSKEKSDDYLLLLYLCSILKDKPTNISVVFTTDYNKDLLSIDCLNVKEITQTLKLEKKYR